MYCPYKNIINFSHTTEYISVKNMPLKPLGQWGQMTPKSTLPLEAREPHLIHECLGRPHLSPQTTARSLHALPHNYATNSPLVTMGCPKFTTKTAPSPLTITTPSNISIPQLTPLTTPNNIWIQSAILPQYTLWTERPTDRPSDVQMVQANIP